MRILWCDDKCEVPAKQIEFRTMWCEYGHNPVLELAKTGDEALARLSKLPAVDLVVMDLLFDDQREDPTVEPLGLKYIGLIRDRFPGLRVATQSITTRVAALAAWLPRFVELGLTDHFATPDSGIDASFRRQVILNSVASKSKVTTAVGLRAATLAAGERYSAVMFADVTGFSSLTEHLWAANRDVMCTALKSFYAVAAQVIHRRGGTIDKFIGDEVMALFILDQGVDDGVLARRVVDTARSLVAEFKRLELDVREQIDQLQGRPISVAWKLKIGVEFGLVSIFQQDVPGGAPEWCAVGQAINLAARIKSLGGDYRIMMGPELRAKLPSRDFYASVEFPLTEPLKGIDPSVKVYRLAE